MSLPINGARHAAVCAWECEGARVRLQFERGQHVAQQPPITEQQCPLPPPLPLTRFTLTGISFAPPLTRPSACEFMYLVDEVESRTRRAEG